MIRPAQREWGLICGCALVVAMLCSRAWAETLPEHVSVYVAGRDGYSCYRIPAIEVAPDGSILAFAEGRKHNERDPGDRNEIDLVGKRSTDNGRTWSPMTLVEHEGKTFPIERPIAHGPAAYSDLAILMDKAAGVLWERNNRTIEFTRLTNLR